MCHSGCDAPIQDPGAANEEKGLPHGGGSVRLYPMPVRLPAGVAPFHPDLSARGGLLQCSHPHRWRLDTGTIQGLWRGQERDAGGLEAAQVRQRGGGCATKGV